MQTPLYISRLILSKFWDMAGRLIFRGMKTNATKYKENLAVSEGCCLLAHMTIKKAMTPPNDHRCPEVGSKNYNKRLEVHKAILRKNKIIIKKNIIFGLKSKLIQHFSDVYEYDEQKVRDAIVKINREKQVAVAKNKTYLI